MVQAKAASVGSDGRHKLRELQDPASGGLDCAGPSRHHNNRGAHGRTDGFAFQRPGCPNCAVQSHRRPNWENNSNWISDEPLDAWYGVSTDANGRVTHLELKDNQLIGEMPAELGDLTNLIRLDLWGNQLTGEMPPEIGRLANLGWLSLGGNQLTGEIPAEMGDLVNLQQAWLRSNLFAGEIPTELSRLANLRKLYLSDNQLTGRIPAELGGLVNLNALSLRDNRLTGEIPAELVNLTNLEWLDLRSNQLTGEIPAELGGLVNLRVLYLGRNQLTGEIPAELGNLSKLRQLALPENPLSGDIPVELARLTNLEALYLAHNQLTGEIPAELGRLTNLETLYLAHNQLTGEIPAELGRLSNLSGLTLRNNQLTGEIPAELGNLTNVRRLDLDGNQLVGEIPAEFGGLFNLKELWLRDNRLSGDLPAELGRLTNLKQLLISGNPLTGCKPVELRHGVWIDFGLPFCDVLLNGLIVSPGSLTPSFDRHRRDYAAGVAPLVTVLPNSYQGTTVHFLDEDGVEMEDADLTMPGFQIDIGPGISTIRIKVVAEDGAATNTYTVKMRRVPGAPTLNTVKAGGGYLSISWTDPDEVAGVEIASYDLRYIRTAADETVDSNWTVATNIWNAFTGTDLQYSITGLSAGIQYEIQVRGVDSNGRLGLWSATGTGVPTIASVCVTGGAVADATNTGIISDCETLLAARDVLAGNTSLNWSPNTSVKDWDGVTVGGTPLRVSSLSVNSRGLDGTIPADLGDLTGLQRLNLSQNRLAGPIPAELGELVNLRVLDLSDNRLTEGIPSQLGRLADLRSLLLQGNELTGVVPPELGGLHNLVEVDLSGNDLRGCPPPTRKGSGSQTVVPTCFAAEGMAFTVETSYLLAADALRITAAGDAANGIVTLDGTKITYTHDGSETTTGGFTYTYTDETLTATARVNIAVSPVNDPPIGAADALTVQEGDTVAVQTQELLANDSDAEADALSITAVAGATNGIVTLDGTTITYTHDGSEEAGGFTYTVTDGTDSATARVNIAVSPVNDPPIGAADALTVQEGDTVAVQTQELLANDSDAEADALSITAVAGATNGIVTLDRNTITYTHDSSETNSGGFTYTVSDGTDSTTALVNITVSPVNDPPAAVEDALAVQEGDTVGVQTQELLANDSDAEADALSITAVAGATNGIVTLDGNTITYTHDGSETNADSFTYTVSDGTDSTTALVNITVSPVNDPPIGAADALTVQEGDTVGVQTQELLANDSDAEADALSITAVAGATNGIVTLDGNTITYTHDGSEEAGGFTYTVSDGTDSATARVNITVSPVNDPPIGAADALTVQEGDTVAVQTQELLANDSDAEADALSITAVAGATNGIVTLDGTTITYAHDGSETNSGGFTYTVFDGADSTTALVNITVSPVNDPPAAAADALTVQEGDTVAVQTQELLANDSDAEADALSITAVAGATNGIVTLDGTTITYAHDGSETNSGGFTYTVFDGADSTTALVNITVSPVNDPPIGAADALTVQEGDTVGVQTQELLANDSDAEADALSITAVAGATNGIVTLDGTTITYAHDGSETNSGGFTYTVSDGTDSTTALVNITVSPVNDPPAAVEDALAVQEGDTVGVQTQELLSNDSDAEADALSITAVAGATNGIVTLDGTTITYTHDSSETNAGGFTYTVSDGTDSATALVNITVSPVNDPPIGAADALAVQEGDTVGVQTQELLANDSDAEADALSITAVAGATNGLVTLDRNTITYTHDGSETNADSFTYTVSDGTDSTTALVNITVTPITDLPVMPLIALALGASLVIVVVLVAIRVRRTHVVSLKLKHRQSPLREHEPQ